MARVIGKSLGIKSNCQNNVKKKSNTASACHYLIQNSLASFLPEKPKTQKYTKLYSGA
jgi:hypothetical protein